MPQDIPATYDGCGERFFIKHTLSCPKGGIVLAWHGDYAKETGDLGDLALIFSDTSYEPKINSRKVQGKSY